MNIITDNSVIKSKLIVFIFSPNWQPFALIGTQEAAVTSKKVGDCWSKRDYIKVTIYQKLRKSTRITGSSISKHLLEKHKIGKKMQQTTLCIDNNLWANIIINKAMAHEKFFYLKEHFGHHYSEVHQKANGLYVNQDCFPFYLQLQKKIKESS